MNTEMITFNEIKELAKASASSGFFPGIKTPEAALVLMALAQAEGLAPIQAMMRYDVIDGKPSKKASAMLIDFLAAGGRVEWHEHNDKAAEATFTHPSGGTIRVRWDTEKAKAAGLTGKQNWQKYPEAMLHARCISSGVRFVYPAATGGMYDPTEVSDFDDKKNWNKLVDKAIEADYKEEIQVVQVQEIKEEEKQKEVKRVDLPPIPDVVQSIPDELLMSRAFHKLSQFRGINFKDMSAVDLEIVICAMSDNKPKVKTELAKQWLTAIEADATTQLQKKVYTTMVEM